MFKFDYSKLEILIRISLITATEIIIPLLILNNLIDKIDFLIITKVNIISLFIFTFLWIFVSYLRGRYSKKRKLNVFKEYLLELRKLFTISIIITISLFFLKVFRVDLNLYSKNLPFIFSIYISLGILNQFLNFNIINYLIPIKSESIYVKGNIGLINEIKLLIRDFEYQKKIKFTCINSDYSSHKIPDKFLVSNKVEFYKDNDELLEYCVRNDVQIFTICNWFENELNCLPVNFLEYDNFLFTKNYQKEKDFEFKLKRISDIFLSLILIIFLSPLVLISGLFIWLTDRGPIFYAQEREGLLRKKLKIFKLRTMIVDAESNGPQWSKKNDKRITFIGKILRKTRIDELPQLISVLKGEMSLIGPRPERPEFNILLENKIPHYNLRHLIKPGLSGWAQVNYPYGSSYKDANNKLSYDLYYISNYSIFLDLIIIFKTMRTIFSGKGSSPH
jgi:exopolysaccharide biosynthesis polyprenyl glycosylphosphotransferase